MVAVPVASAWSPSKVIVPCTGQAALVAAINAANAAGGGTINLARGCHYSLTSSPDNSENGLPAVQFPIGVNGNGATIDGTNSFRVFEVDGPGGNLTLNNVTITGGAAKMDFGGGIANLGGVVTLNRSQVTRNMAAEAGGGIASATFDPASVAKLTLNNSAVTGNSQTLPPSQDPNAVGGVGGGGIINLLGTATLNGSRVSHNTANGMVGGGIANGDYMNFSGTTSFLTLNRSQVDDNKAPNAGGGGGIQNLLGTVTLNGSEVNRNTAPNGAGISSGNGNGGVMPPPGTSHLVLNGSQVNGNIATAPVPGTGGESGPPIAGGGIANGGSAVLNSSQVDFNTAQHTSGAGIVNHGAMTLNRSEVNFNTAQGNNAAGTPAAFASGGGIINAQGPPGAANTAILTLNSSLVAGNRAAGDGGGIANGMPLGGPMPLVGGPVTLNHTLVIGNQAAKGGGIFNSGGTVTLASSLVLLNHPDNCEPLGTIAGCIG